jgi:glutamate-5-semialdehyde dehydrogenase
MSIEKTIQEMAEAARGAAREIGRCSADLKNEVLLDIAAGLQAEASFIQQENEKDLTRAKEQGLSAAMLDRLKVTDSTIQSMADGLKAVASLSDPVGSLSQSWLRPNGLQVSRMRIPLGVIGIIYESRPNVTVDAAGLCLKAGNAVILRGGSEALDSNKALSTIIKGALEKTGLAGEIVQVVPVRDRTAVHALSI